MSMSSLSSLSSDDELQQMPQRDRKNPPKLDAFVHYSDEEFKTLFRLSKETVLYVAKLIGPQIAPSTNRSKAVSARDQVCVTLGFFATGSHQRVIGDVFHLQQASVHRIVHRVTAAIASLSKQFIRMPETDSERDTVVTKFYTIAGFPRVLGALDCTHIRTISPGGSSAKDYKNSKGYFSLNVEVVGDADLLIRSVIARWPGALHDSVIFNNSPLPARFQCGDYGQYLLLGDSAYPCRPYLLTPVANPTIPAEETYNHAHTKTRKTIERLLSVLKGRFPCLQVGLGIKMERVPAIVVACCVLHNIAILRNDTYNSDADVVDEEHDIHNDDIIFHSDPHGESVRNEMIQNFFS